MSIPGDLPSLTARLQAVLEARPEIREAYLFGSHARSEAQAHSDVDVAVYVAPPIPLTSPFGYESEVAAELMADLGSDHVDVVCLNRATPLLYHRVLRDGIRLFSKDLKATTTREGQALSRYCDFVPQLQKLDAARRAQRGAAR